MRLCSLPEQVQNAILGSAVGLAAHLETHEFLGFWDKILDADYPNPTKTKTPDLVEVGKTQP